MNFITNIIRYIHPGSVFIYQMGKVGSSSIEASVENSIHIHNFYDNDPCYINMHLHFPGLSRYFKYHMFYFFRRVLFRLRRETKIITVVRDPHDRNVSMFFQNLHSWLVAAYTGFPKGRNNVRQVLGRAEGIEVLHQVYDSVFPKEYPLNWFDFEFKRITGVDVYDYEFNTETGVAEIKNGKYRILIIRADVINSNRDLIAKFLGDDTMQLSYANDGGKKWYAPVYKEFKKTYKTPESDMKMYAESRYFRHFFGC